ncbi:hypothetical protein Q5424_27775 [Conexibacter sp. JD483]|nr:MULTISPECIES: hypothetical protein [unclassified Conexibacter]MDO8189552.1 hypothetical protein [Conexibacter sp. CPCC 205706]MDO8202112.1 hypothetical protein [Conexibacter sp. CPCC 205762]MDR9372932.1 hypothetical protein [Conexibacter sp. JD483]
METFGSQRLDQAVALTTPRTGARELLREADLALCAAKTAEHGSDATAHD